MRQPPKELVLFDYLRGRFHFSNADKQRYQNILKGYKGEKQFSTLIQEQLQQDYLCIPDLLLEHQGTVCQFDMLLIFQQTLYLFEIKNYQGEFQIENDHLHCYTTNKNYRNPKHQLKRSELMLKDLLSGMGAHFQMKAYVVFMNPQFTLFQATRDQPIILPTQVVDFVQSLNHIPGVISKKHQQLANKLNNMHINNSPYTRYPTYTFDQMRKGIFCKKCRNCMERSRLYFYCSSCNYKENKDASVMRQIIEFSVLFPEQKIRTGIIHQWINKYITKVTLRNILVNYMHQEKNYRYTYYTFKNDVDI